MNSMSLFTKYLVLFRLSFYKRGFNMNDNKKSCKSRAQQPKSSRHKQFFHHRLKISFDFFLFFTWAEVEMKWNVHRWDPRGAGQQSRAWFRPCGLDGVCGRFRCSPTCWHPSDPQLQLGPSARRSTLIHSDPLSSGSLTPAGYRNRPNLSKYKPVQSASIKRGSNHQVVWDWGNISPIIFA